MSTPKVVQDLNRLVEINRELDPLLAEKRELEARIKATAERMGKKYFSTQALNNGKVLRVSIGNKTSWSSPALRKLAEKLGASAHQMNACKSVGTSTTIGQVNPA